LKGRAGLRVLEGNPVQLGQVIPDLVIVRKFGSVAGGRTVKLNAFESWIVGELLGAGASVIVTASISGLKGQAGLGMYSTTKAALRTLVRTWVLELKGRGIRVNAMSPGTTVTPGLEGLAGPGADLQGFYDDLLVQFNGLKRDNNLRPDISIEKLASLGAAFDRKGGTLSAGNSTPLTDGASAVLLASEEWAKQHGLKPLAYLTHSETSAVDFVGKKEGLLMAPAYAVPRMLQRAGLTLQDFDFYEIHEAFASQVLATLAAWESPEFCKEKLGLDSPLGSIDNPLRPLSIAIGAEATFVARTVDVDINHLTQTLKRASEHKGTAFIEIYQNCKIFNDGVFEYATDKSIKADNTLFLEHGKPLIFGKDRSKGIRLHGLDPEVVTLGSGINVDDLLIHDEKAEEPSLAYLLSRMVYPRFPECIGVFRCVERPTYDELINKQIADVQKAKGKGKIEELFHSDDIWVVQ